MVEQRLELRQPGLVAQEKLLRPPSWALQLQQERVVRTHKPPEWRLFSPRASHASDPLRPLLAALEEPLVERRPLHQPLLVAEPWLLLIQQLLVRLVQGRLPQHLRVPDALALEARLRQPRSPLVSHSYWPIEPPQLFGPLGRLRWLLESCRAEPLHKEVVELPPERAELQLWSSPHTQEVKRGPQSAASERRAHYPRLSLLKAISSAVFRPRNRPAA